MSTLSPQAGGSSDRAQFLGLIRATLEDGRTERMLLLSREDAQVTLNEAWDILGSSSISPSFCDSPSSRIILRRTCVKLAQKYDILPSAIFLRNVVLLESDCRHGGSFADVYYAKLGDDFIALKKLRVFLTTSAKEREKIRKDLYRETLLWKGLSHPNVLPFLGVSGVFPGMISMVLPWMPTTIRSHRENLQYEGLLSDSKRFKEIVHSWLRQVALGLDYLHEEGVVHGDLHGGNILVDEQGRLRLTDFGMALIADATPFGYASIHTGGAVYWRAPELLDPALIGSTSTRSTKSSDMWAFGCVCVELYTGDKPFPDLIDFQVPGYVLAGNRPLRPFLPGGEPMEDGLWSLTESCWNLEPQSRPHSRDVSERLCKLFSPPGPTLLSIPTTILASVDKAASAAVFNGDERQPLLPLSQGREVLTLPLLFSRKIIAWYSVLATLGFFTTFIFFKGLIDAHFDLVEALKSALGGNLGGAAILVFQVFTLMPFQTVMNYQYRYGTSPTVAKRTLYADGGWTRYYQGLIAALVQIPVTRFGDTAAIASVLALLQSDSRTEKLPMSVRTMLISLAATGFRMILTPIDTVKTTMQTDGKAGVKILKNRIKKYGVGSLWYGAFATSAATPIRDFIWVGTSNYLDWSLLLRPTTGLQEISRRNFITFFAAIIAYTLSNSLHVVGTYRQVHHSRVGYWQAAEAVIADDGWKGLFGRGLKIVVVANGSFGLMSFILWGLTLII